jgi:hypothetical protein
MAKSLKKAEPKIELRLDGWDRFKTAVGAAAKSGPKHVSAKKSLKRPRIAKEPRLSQSASGPNNSAIPDA